MTACPVVRFLTATLAAAVWTSSLHAQAIPTRPVAGATAAHAVFVDGQTQVVSAFADPGSWIREELWVETEFDSDGDGALDRVHVDVTRPAQTDTEGLKVPVVYESSPYYAGVGSTDGAYFWNVHQELGDEPPVRQEMPDIAYERERPIISTSQLATWVPRGFAVVHSESPGTGLSDGCPTVGGINESLAPAAVVDWLNGRARGFTTPGGDEQVPADWSTGKVGMTGTSYNGTLPLAAATTGVEGLEAIIPIAPNTSYYHYYRSNGLVRSPGGYLGEDVDVLYDFINSGDPARRAYCDATIRDGEMARGRDRVTGDYNDFWAGRDYLNAIDGVRAATLMAHGFNDWNVMPEHSYRIAQALEERGVPTMVYYHQDGHGGPPPLELMNRWFTRYLYGVDNGVEDDPRAWIVREGADADEPTPYPDYPNPDAEPVTLHPQAGGAGLGRLSIDDRGGQGTEALTDDVSFDGAALASAVTSGHRLLYATPELTDEVHLSGVATVTIRIAADAPAANLSVWLVSLPWTEGARITDNLITRGWADPQNAESLTESEPLAPGEFRDLTFDLQPDDQVVAAGQRIGLMIFSSDPEFTLWPEPGTEVTIDLDRTSITLPVVGGRAALQRLISQDGPVHGAARPGSRPMRTLRADGLILANGRAPDVRSRPPAESRRRPGGIRILHRTLALTVALLAVPAVAAAQQGPPWNAGHVTLMAGVSVFDREGVGTTGIYALRADVPVYASVLLEGGLSYARPTGENDIGDVFIPGIQVQLQGTAGRFSPYVGLGGGVTVETFDDLRSEDVSFSPSGSVGIRIAVSDGAGIRFEGRLNAVGADFRGLYSEMTGGISVYW